MNLRLLALAGAAACVVALPLAVASAGQPGDEKRTVAPAAGRSGVYGDGDEKASSDGPSLRQPSSGQPPARQPSSGQPPARQPSDPTPAGSDSPYLLGLGLATAARCGPELTSPDGIEAQTCVLTQGTDTWARTYYRNATGRALDAVLSLMEPQGRTVQMRCAVAAEDEPEVCDTPREPTRGRPDAYTAITEFAEADGSGPLLLRVGSNSPAHTGS
ncbi:hypothetical protein [Streptomyces griseosporeus]|uniref:hypothetical protein n=1 Tax=Streptomyces griseosporeus TaxID=1910 RepID=UPI0037ADF65A